MKKMMMQLDKTLADMQTNEEISATTTVASATQFLERLRGMRLTADEAMVSFDVTSLCTSISQDCAVKTVSELLEKQYDDAGPERKSKHGIRPNVNSTAGEPRTEMHLPTPQFGADEGAVMITAASITTPTYEETYTQDTNMTIDPGRQLRSMRTQTMAAPLNERHVN
ncbi:unnamed protein product [Schistocephalus solidus]|uniref:Integrase core domain containing protein n=1 Tax=Schistocephalus solidus TaxID=70667 RepID=A0A183TNT8_SCHSO|nr:unnamed protein product [Schistocephalus solidus]